MDIAQLVVSSLCLVAILADLYVSARFARPQRRRAIQLELARVAVAAAEQRFRGAARSGKDKARYAREYLIGQGLTPATADVLVERVVTEVRVPKEEPKP